MEKYEAVEMEIISIDGMGMIITYSCSDGDMEAGNGGQ